MHALRLICTPEQVDELSGELWDAGTEGLQEVDVGGDLELIAGFSDPSRGSELMARFAAYQPRWEAQPDTDWVAFTHGMWPPREVGSRLFLTPPWFEGETPTGRNRVVHNPGLASGTGEHPCTQLALGALERSLQPGMHVLDVGTGSGILAIAAAQLGAQVFALDVDADALNTARENFELNSLEPRLVAGTVDCLASHCADLVVANVSGTVLLSIFDDLLRLARSHLILTGFTEDEVRAFTQVLPGAEVTQMEVWCCVSASLS